MSRRRALLLGCAVGVAVWPPGPAALRAQDGAPTLDRGSCLTDHVEDYFFADCLFGDAGPLSQPERDAVLAQLREAVATRFDRVEHELYGAVLVPDAEARAVVVELLVARGLVPAGVQALLVDLDDGERRLARALRRRGPEVRSLRAASCSVVPALTTADRLALVCENMIGCGRTCFDRFARAEIAVDARGWHVEHADVVERPSGGGCGECDPGFDF